MHNEQDVNNEKLSITLHPHHLCSYKNSGSEKEHTVMHPLGPISASLDGDSGRVKDKDGI
jgi:hypothetical protein